MTADPPRPDVAAGADPTHDRGSAARKIIIAVVVIVVLLIAVDRIGDLVAERYAADTIQSSQHLNSRPDVDVTGFPFLTQFATGHYGEIVITAEDVPIGNDSVHLNVSSLRVDLDDVTISHDFSTFRAKRATADATIGYDELSGLIGLDVSYVGNGTVRASKTVSLAGHDFTASVTAVPTLTHGVLSFGRIQLNNAGQIGATVANVLHEAFNVTVPMHGLPFHVRVKSLKVDSNGLEIGLRGAGLHYSH